MKVVPLGQRVLIKDVPPEEKTAGGIIIPESGKKKTQIAEVLVAGPLEGTTLNAGDKIIYSPYSGTEISFEGDNLRIVDVDDILAVVAD